MPSSTAKIRFALIGCGRMGRHHSEKILADGRAEVVAAFDPVEAAARQLQQSLWPNARVTGSLDELMMQPDVDAAIICTPTAEHYPQAIGCLDRGWHVLCEKPLASNRTQILELIAAAERCRTRKQAFSLGYQRRFTALYRTLRKEVFSERWGAVRAVVSHNVEHWQPTIGGTWRDDPSQNPGGFITDAGSHKIDCVFYVSGLKPVEVFARCQKWNSQVEIVSSVSALLTGDVTLTMDFVGNAQYLGEDLHIHCERADLMIRHEELWLARDGRRERLESTEPNSNPVTGLLDTILLGAEDLSPPESALNVYDLTQAILESGRTGQPIKRVPGCND